METFPGEQEIVNQQPGLEHPETKSKLPGFGVEKGYDLNVLYKDKIIDDEKFSRAKMQGKVLYEDIGYHHKQSKGQKSQAPIHPTEALKKSIRFSPNSNRRVGVDPVNDEYIIFSDPQESVDGKLIYHGHIVTDWDKGLKAKHRNALIDAKLVRPNGDIIK